MFFPCKGVWIRYKSTYFESSLQEHQSNVTSINLQRKQCSLGKLHMVNKQINVDLAKNRTEHRGFICHFHTVGLQATEHLGCQKTLIFRVMKIQLNSILSELETLYDSEQTIISGQIIFRWYTTIQSLPSLSQSLPLIVNQPCCRVHMPELWTERITTDWAYWNF